MIQRMRLQPEALGLGMTGQRVRDRLIERLREQGVRDERVLSAVRTPNCPLKEETKPHKPVESSM
jgi:protein-L-isoaspartate(D-aspartate) O-methyltransferase